MKPLADCRLYAFVDTAYLHGRALAEIARQLCDGGADIIQLRAKDAAPNAIRRMAESLLPVTSAAGVPLVINDHPDIAAEIGAPYCHLGQEDLEKWSTEPGKRNEATHNAGAVSPFRVPPSAFRVGLSTHAPAQAERALRADPAYIAIGPVFATPTKPGRPPVTLDYVRWAAAHVRLPWFAIGGITLNNLDDVLAAGARRICVVSAILNHTDPAAACREFRKRLSA